MIKDTDFKFDTRVAKDSPDKPKMGRGHGHAPTKFWALNANSSKTVKVTDFKVDIYTCSQDSPDITP